MAGVVGGFGVGCSGGRFGCVDGGDWLYPGASGAGVVRGDAGRVAVAAADPAVGRVDHRCAGTHGPPVRRVHWWLAVVVDGGTVGVVDRDRAVGAFHGPELTGRGR